MEMCVSKRKHLCITHERGFHLITATHEHKEPSTMCGKNLVFSFKILTLTGGTLSIIMVYKNCNVFLNIYSLIFNFSL